MSFDHGFIEVVAFVLVFLFLANLIAFAAFAHDKSQARMGGWRVSESTLLTLAFLGGSVGALLGQRILRHKTRKEPFRTQLRLILIMHGGTLALIYAALAYEVLRGV